MRENMKKARIAAGLSQKQVAVSLNVSPPTVSEWESGKQNPSAENLKKLSELYNVPVDYLLGLSDCCISINSELSEDNAIKLQAYFNQIFAGIHDPSNPPRTLIPVVGTVAAGLPVFAEDDILDYEEVTPETAARGELFALRVKGSSMEPRIMEGDVVIVRRQSTAVTGDTVVCKVNGDEATVKKIKIRPDGWTLLPTNPAFDPLIFTCAEIESLPVTIIGKVIELRGKF